MRRATLILMTLLVAFAASATDIPNRPEQLTFPDLDFTLPDAAALRYELSNGTPVYALPDTEFPLINLTILFNGGNYMNPPGEEGLAELADEAWRSGGAGDMTAQELDEELDFLAANLSTTVGDVSGSVSLNVLAKDIDRGLELMMALVTSPRFQDDRFAKAKDDTLQAMKRRNDDSGDIEAREWDRLLFGDDYWSNRLPTKASIGAITADDCRAFVTSLVRSGNIVVAVTGDFDAAAMKAKLAGTIGTLPVRTAPVPPVPQPAAGAAPGIYLIDKPDVNQGRLRIGQLGFRLGHPDEFALRVGNDILGGGGFTARMMKKIRSDEGLTYGAYSSTSFPVTMPGTFEASLQTKSSTVAYSAELVFNLIGSMRDGKVTDEELTTSKASFIETFPRRFENPRQVVSLYATDELLGRPHSYWTSYRDRIQAVDAGEIQKAFQRDIQPAKMVVLIVGNLAEILAGHPDHEAAIADLGPITRVPLRDPMTLEPLSD